MANDGPLEVARIFLVTNIPPAYATERGLRNCFRQYCGQEGPQVEYSNVKSPDNNTEAALVTVEGLSSEGAHDALQQKMLLGGRTLNVSHVCSELVTLQFGDVDGHLSQTMQKIAGRMGLHFTIQRKEVCISGPFDLVQQFRMDLRAEVFLMAQCSSFTSVMSAASQSVPSVLAASKKAPQIPFSAPRETTTGSMNSKINEIPSEVQNNTDAAQSPFSNQKTLENDTHMVIDNLSPDVLQLLDKIPEGDISGVQYNPSLGTVTVQGLNKADVEETTAKFEEVFKSIVEKLQVDIVPLDKDEDISTLLSLVNELNHQYVHCAFIHSEDTQMVKIISNSTEQMEQAKKQLLEQLNQTTPTSPAVEGGAAEGGAAGKRSVEDFSTKLKSGHTIMIKKGDITKESASVLVTMINDRFQSVGDMSAAVNAASRGNVQQKVQEYTRQNSLVNVGDLIVTRGGGSLKCKNVYNIVCPDVTDSINVEEPRVAINGLVTKVLSEAERQKARTVVMPSFMSTVFVDVEMVARAVTEAIFDYCYHYHSGNKHPMVSNITVVVGDEATYSCFVRNLNQSRSGNRSTEGQGRAAEVKAVDNGAGHHPSLPVTVHKAVDSSAIHPPSLPVVLPPPTSNPPKTDTTPDKSTSTSPAIINPMSTKATAANPPTVSGPVPNITTSPASSSPKLPRQKDHPLYHTPELTANTSRSNSVMDENCPVCGGPFTTPMTSKCEHAFCDQCMSRAIQHGTPLCPVCKVSMEGLQPSICPLCKEQVMEAVTTVCCHQLFCRECLTKHLKLFNQCPYCKHTFESAKKTQPLPSSSMSFTCLSSPLPGYAGCDTIQITYDVPNGIDANGQPYLGASRVAYLPDNIEGREILKLLQKAWNKELIYYVGPKSEVVWTDIPHKINTTGGQLNRGYPDQQYFYNVKQSLASKGIVP